MKTRLNEVRKLQKLAGILAESESGKQSKPSAWAELNALLDKKRSIEDTITAVFAKATDDYPDYEYTEIPYDKSIINRKREELAIINKKIKALGFPYDFSGPYDKDASTDEIKEANVNDYSSYFHRDPGAEGGMDNVESDHEDALEVIKKKFDEYNEYAAEDGFEPLDAEAYEKKLEEADEHLRILLSNSLESRKEPYAHWKYVLGRRGLSAAAENIAEYVLGL